MSDIPRQVQLSMIRVVGVYVILCGTRGWLSVVNMRSQSHIIPTQPSHYKESKVLAIATTELIPKSDVVDVPWESPEHVYMIATGDRLGGLAQWLLASASDSLVLVSFTDVHEAIVSVGFASPSMQSSAEGRIDACACVGNRSHPHQTTCCDVPLLFVGSDVRCCLFQTADACTVGLFGHAACEGRLKVSTAPSSIASDAATTTATAAVIASAGADEYPWHITLLSLLEANASEQDSAYYALRECKWSVDSRESDTVATSQNNALLTMLVDKVITDASGCSRLVGLQIQLKRGGIN